MALNIWRSKWLQGVSPEAGDVIAKYWGLESFWQHDHIRWWFEIELMVTGINCYLYKLDAKGYAEVE